MLYRKTIVMEKYPFYDALLIIFGIYMIYLSIRRSKNCVNDVPLDAEISYDAQVDGDVSKKSLLDRIVPVLLRVFCFCFGIFWIVFPWIYHRTEFHSSGIIPAIDLDVIYMFWGILPAFIGFLVGVCFIFVVVKWLLDL